MNFIKIRHEKHFLNLDNVVDLLIADKRVTLYLVNDKKLEIDFVDRAERKVFEKELYDRINN